MGRWRLVPLFLFSFVAASGHAEVISVGLLQGEACYDAAPEADSTPENQRYWYKRHAPYLGYRGGEQLLAGGDGTCVVGFPGFADSTAQMLVNGQVVRLVPEGPEIDGHQVFQASDQRLRVEIEVTGTETTCEPQGESCCGDYIFATITVSNANESVAIMAVRYSGS